MLDRATDRSYTVGMTEQTSPGVQTLTITQLAKYVNIPKRTLYNMVKQGRFPVEPLRGMHPRRWSAADVEAWVRSES